VKRRALFGKVAAIAVAVAAAPAVQAEAAPELTQGQIDALYVKAYGQAKFASLAPGYRKGYDEGMRVGLAGAIDHYFSIEDMAYRTVAIADGKYVARLDEHHDCGGGRLA